MSDPFTPPDEGAWIFVSHSHRDLQAVRRVRDALESKGHQPLLFFLKCLDDDSEIDDLIRREIEARQFFLLCDSANARDSNWVQQEVRLIKELAGKVSLTVDLAGPWQDQLGAIDELSRRATVYLSYVRENGRLVRRIAEALRERDYRILVDVQPELGLGGDWVAAATSAVDDALAHGYVVVFLSPEALDAVEAAFVVAAMEHAVARAAATGKSSNVIPVLVSDRERTLDLLASSPAGEAVGQLQMVDFTSGDFDDNFAELLRTLVK